MEHELMACKYCRKVAFDAAHQAATTRGIAPDAFISALGYFGYKPMANYAGLILRCADHRPEGELG